jgi:acyl-coenzyme A synthetase/AMP-(fatty) acid ligase
MNASEPIRRNARLLPEAPAFVRKDASEVTFAEMERTVDAIASRLRALPCGPGDVAALESQDLYKYLCVTLALARVGAAVGPAILPPGMATLAIGDRAADPRSLAVDALFEGAPAEAPVPIHADPQAVFAYCPSSGTTAGVPKIVPFTHDLTQRRIAARTLSAPPVPGTRHVSMVGPTSVFGLQRSLRTLWNGCAVVEPNLDAQEIPGWLAATGITFLSLSPIGLRKLLECLPEDGMRCAVALIEIGGGLLPPVVQAMCERRLPAQIVCSYGSTETGPVAAAPIRALHGRMGAVGFPFPGVTVEIVDDDDRPLPPGQAGILRVRSSHTATTYVGNPAASARTFRNGWVYPNDNGVVEPDGAVRLMGRTDDVINTNGVKVSPQAIEEAMMTLGDLREVAVFGVPDPEGMTAMCAAIVPNQPVNAEAFHERCRAKLGRFSPAFIMHLPALPRNAMGKVLRNELARMALETTAARKPAVR